MDFHTFKKFNKKTTGAKHLLSFLITDANRRKLNAYLKNRLMERMRRRAFEDRAANLKDVVGSSLRHITPVNQPLVLIDSLPLAGGDQLNQLFDGHPQLHVCPGELKLEFDQQKKSGAPKQVLVDNPHKWFAVMAQENIDIHLEEVHKNLDLIGSSLPFVFIPYLQKRIFLRYLKSEKPRNLRTVYNAYMTSYFGSWLNYANLNGHDKKYIVGLFKTNTIQPDRVETFFEIYPEGKIVSIIRDPGNWTRATSAHVNNIYPGAKSTVIHWRESTKAMIRNKEVYGNRVCIIRHEDLRNNTEAVMRHLCRFLSIEFDGILLSPTFNCSGVRALNYADMDGDLQNNPLPHSEATPIEEIDGNWNQALNEYEAVLRKIIQL